MKKKVVLVLSALVVLVGGLWFWSSYQTKNAPATPVSNKTILFYGNECPHCQDVEKFIEENKIAEKVSFDSLEVWHNKSNSAVMLEKAGECGFAKDQLGVPFLYASGKCFMGGPEVEKFFRQEAGI